LEANLRKTLVNLEQSPIAAILGIPNKITLLKNASIAHGLSHLGALTINTFALIPSRPFGEDQV
jgi:hypothetical protein